MHKLTKRARPAKGSASSDTGSTSSDSDSPSTSPAEALQLAAVEAPRLDAGVHTAAASSSSAAVPAAVTKKAKKPVPASSVAGTLLQGAPAAAPVRVPTAGSAVLVAAHSTIPNPSLGAGVGVRHLSTAVPAPAPVTGTSTQSAFDSLSDHAAGWGLSDELLRACARVGMRRFFPVQAAVVPDIIRAHRSCDATFGDVCVSAPTGSGKTLAYALPVVQCVLDRVVPRTRVLVLVPTRELVQQVLHVFNSLLAHAHAEGPAAAATAAEGSDHADAPARALPLTVFAVTGHHSFVAEQQHLVPTRVGVYPPDILVSTPGRLVDHLDQTPGFTLQHLRFLVVDEADRMLSQSYHNWVNRVYASVYPPMGVSTPAPTHLLNYSSPGYGGDLHTHRVRPDPGVGMSVADCAGGGWGVFFGPLGGSGAGAGAGAVGNLESMLSGSGSLLPTSFRRIVCSATLTRNPRKLAQLDLRHPRHYNCDSDVLGGQGTVVSIGGGTGVHTIEATAAPGAAAGAGAGAHDTDKEQYRTPEGLSEAMIVCSADEKPLVLLLLLRGLVGRSALVFTGSVEATHRLTRLLQLFGPLSDSLDHEPASVVVEFSASLPQKRRDKALKQLRSPGTRVVISSDAAARGVDIPLLSAVIQYDAPARPKTYVHRVGRTARAGNTGVTYTLVKPDQARHFKEMLKRIENSSVVKETVMRDSLLPMMDRYQAALTKLKVVLDEELKGVRFPFEPVGPLAGHVVVWGAAASKTSAGVAAVPVVPVLLPLPGLSNGATGASDAGGGEEQAACSVGSDDEATVSKKVKKWKKEKKEKKENKGKKSKKEKSNDELVEGVCEKEETEEAPLEVVGEDKEEKSSKKEKKEKKDKMEKQEKEEKGKDETKAARKARKLERALIRERRSQRKTAATVSSSADSD